MKISKFIKTTTIDWEGRISSIVELSDDGDIEMNDVIEYIASREGTIDSVIIAGDEPVHYREIVSLIKEFRSHKLKIKVITDGKCPDSLDDLIGACYVDAVRMNINTSDLTDEMRRTISIILENEVEQDFRTVVDFKSVRLDDIMKMSSEIKSAKHYTIVLPRKLPDDVHKADVARFIEFAKRSVKDVKAITE